MHNLLSVNNQYISNQSISNKSISNQSISNQSICNQSISHQPSYDINKFICPIHKLNIMHYCKCKDHSNFLLCEGCFDDENCPNYRHTFHDLGAFKQILRVLFDNHADPKLLENYLAGDYARYGHSILNQKKTVLEELKLLSDIINEKMHLLSQDIMTIFKIDKESIDITQSETNRLEKLLANVIDECDNENIKKYFSAPIIKEEIEQYELNDRKFKEKIMRFRKCFEEDFFKNLDNLKYFIIDKEYDFSNANLTNINNFKNTKNTEKFNSPEKLKSPENALKTSKKELISTSLSDSNPIKKLKLESILKPSNLDKIIITDVSSSIKEQLKEAKYENIYATIRGYKGILFEPLNPIGISNLFLNI